MRFGFLGASRIGRNALAPAIQAAGFEIVAVGARDEARAAAFAHDFAIPAAHAGYDAVLADPAVEAVYIPLANDAHLPWTLKALAAGKHVLCEKPLALSAAEVRAMMAAEAESGRVVMEAYCHLFHPQLARLGALLASGAIGRLLAMQATFANRLDRPDDFRWQRAMGGGAMLDIGCYCTTLMRQLAGREPLRVAASQETRRGVDATLSGLLDFGEGLTGQFLCSLDAERAQHLSLHGSDGTLVLDWPFSTKGRATGLTVAGRREEFPAIDPYVEMVRHFAQAARGEVAMARGLSFSLDQARLHDALLAAARDDCWVAV